MPSRRELADAIRALSMDAVQAARSGHPGAPMGMADIAQVVWSDFLRHNPANPGWMDRDRFVLSNGHGSMLLYSLLYLTGYDLGVEDLRQFRQLHSRTAGHPERGLTPGVETTTGPLGQGLANAVGMALAERLLGARYNREGLEVIDHRTYVFVGDGCLMEGVSHEVCSLAGTLRLGKLIAIYDDNGISIDGPVQGWFGDDTPGRFEAYGWHVLADVDGHDPEAVSRALKAAQADTGRPSLICCKTTIGYGAPNLGGSHETHGAPLGDAEVAATREHIGWPHPPFEIPPALLAAWDAREAGVRLEQDWSQRFERYRSIYPEPAAELERCMNARLPEGFADLALEAARKAQQRQADIPTRKASQNALNLFGPLLPELVGGSSDLTPSNNTTWSGSRALAAERPQDQANYIHYGVREFGMSAIMNGLALHGGLIPYGGTFLVFSDYARNAVRMAALMGLGSIFVYTHDSVGLGEDGPTHQPVEHTASLRLIPNLDVWRPCDEVEALVAWAAAIERRNGPSCLLFSRQNLPAQERTEVQRDSIRRGGYVLRDCNGEPEAVVIATGSEVQLAVEAARSLECEGRRVRVVSVPCLEAFQAQDSDYREAVLPTGVGARVIVEAGVTLPWQGYAGATGRVIGIDRFGESAPGSVVMKTLGLTVERVVEALREII